MVTRMDQIHAVQVHHGDLLVCAWCVRLYCESVGDNRDKEREVVENQVYAYYEFVDFGLGS